MRELNFQGFMSIGLKLSMRMTENKSLYIFAILLINNGCKIGHWTSGVFTIYVAIVNFVWIVRSIHEVRSHF